MRFISAILFRVFLATLAVAGVFLLFEAVVRLALPEPESLAKLRSSPTFLYENKPNAVFPYSSQGEFENEIHVNSYGFRDDEFRKEKPSDVLRIAVLGDSQEEALQVALSDTWQKVMAKAMSEELGRLVESYNFGVSGYGTDQQWLTLMEKVWQFSPDMVILAFSPNDVGDTYKNKLVRLENGLIELVSFKERAGGNLLGLLLRETYTYHLAAKAAGASPVTKKIFEGFRSSILGFAKEERFFLSDAQLTQGPFEVVASQKYPPREVTETWQIVMALVAHMKRQADSHGAKFFMTINIPRAQVLEGDWEYLRRTYRLDPATSSPYQINEVIREIAQDLAIAFYDGRLDAIKWQAERGDLHFKRDSHFNKNGHLFMGTKVAESIISAKLFN